jgi:hypothetical protein
MLPLTFSGSLEGCDQKRSSGENLPSQHQGHFFLALNLEILKLAKK